MLSLLPDVVRCAYMEIQVTNLKAAREFYVDILGLVVTAEDDKTLYLRSMEEFIHHNLVLREGRSPPLRRLLSACARRKTSIAPKRISRRLAVAPSVG